MCFRLLSSRAQDFGADFDEFGSDFDGIAPAVDAFSSRAAIFPVLFPSNSPHKNAKLPLFFPKNKNKHFRFFAAQKNESVYFSLLFTNAPSKWIKKNTFATLNRLFLRQFNSSRYHLFSVMLFYKRNLEHFT